MGSKVDKGLKAHCTEDELKKRCIVHFLNFLTSPRFGPVERIDLSSVSSALLSRDCELRN